LPQLTSSAGDKRLYQITTAKINSPEPTCQSEKTSQDSH